MDAPAEPPPPRPVEVPRAANVPADIHAQAAQASATPAFIEFSKQAAVITFSPPPPPMAPHEVPVITSAPKPAPPKKPPPPPPAAAPAGRGGSRAIEGTPLRAELSDPPPGPMPARRSAAPSQPHQPTAAAVPEITFGSTGSIPRVDAEAPRPDLGAIVAGDDFPPLDLPHAAAPPSKAAFARGSAIETSDNAPLLIDVTPMSLRIETVGGYSDVLIAANSPVPCEKARTFLTASDGQTVVFIRVAQGESVKFAENTRLGELELSGLKSAPRGSVKILVTFELDADGILNVRAKDKDTDHETKATMRLLGADTDAAELDAMRARQNRHVVA
jgi:molecular chaperone DnaK